MSCLTCDDLRKSPDGSVHINESGRFIFFLEYGENNQSQIVVRDQYNEVGGDGIRLDIDCCPYCGEPL